MAVPTGTKGLRCALESFNTNENRKLTTIESSHRQSVSEHMKSFMTVQEKPEHMKILSEQIKPNGNFESKVTTDNGNSNGLAKAFNNPNCFCGKAHAGGRKDCAWFC